jgi:hypothetical protein
MGMLELVYEKKTRQRGTRVDGPFVASLAHASGYYSSGFELPSAKGPYMSPAFCDPKPSSRNRAFFPIQGVDRFGNQAAKRITPALRSPEGCQQFFLLSTIRRNMMRSQGVTLRPTSLDSKSPDDRWRPIPVVFKHLCSTTQYLSNAPRWNPRFVPKGHSFSNAAIRKPSQRADP